LTHKVVVSVQKLGWRFLSLEEAYKARGEMFTNVLLDDILAKQLDIINNSEYRDESYRFSTGNIKGLSIPLGLVQTNERIYDLLTLGKSFNEIVKRDRKAYAIKYILEKPKKQRIPYYR